MGGLFLKTTRQSVRMEWSFFKDNPTECPYRMVFFKDNPTKCPYEGGFRGENFIFMNNRYVYVQCFIHQLEGG